MSDAARRVVVDARLARSSGHRTYLRSVFPRLVALAPDWRWTLLGDSRQLESDPAFRHANVAVVSCEAPVYALREQFVIPRLVPLDADLLWVPHYNVPITHRGPLLVTIHDAAHLRLPEYSRHALKYAYARLFFAAAVGKARAIICNSEFTRSEIRALHPGADGRVTVVPMGVGDEWFQRPDATPPISGPYFLFVGNFKPHKNLRTLLAAFTRVAAQGVERLVLVGKTTDLMTADREALNEVQALGDRVVMAGDVPDEALRALVAGATALVMPSLYEGFGFPPLEAMATGTPAIVARAGALPETAGDAALYFDPRDATALAAALRRVASDDALRRQLVERGKAQARRFSWDETARRTLEVMRRATISAG